MKIAYLIRHDITRNDGVTKKILGQINHWNSMGHVVQIYAYVPKKGDSILSAKQFVMDGAVKSRLMLDDDLYSDVSFFNPDMVYFRYDTWSITLSKIISKYTSIVELNTLDLSEFYALFKLQKSIKSFLRYSAYKLLRGLILRKVKGIVSVTNEIKNDFSNKKYNKPGIAVPNGIDLSEYKVIKSRNNDCSRQGLFFIGTPGQPWHGVDYIENLASKLPNFDFHIVGIEGKNTANLFYHGYLNTMQYKDILKKCSICIGSLGLHRINMREACPLKVREYLAYGYPIIIGYEDTAFINENTTPGFVFSLDTTRDFSECTIIELEEFIVRMKNIVVSSVDVSYIDTKYLESTRLAFFENSL